MASENKKVDFKTAIARLQKASASEKALVAVCVLGIVALVVWEVVTLMSL